MQCEQQGLTIALVVGKQLPQAAMTPVKHWMSCGGERPCFSGPVSPSARAVNLAVQA